MAQIEEAQLDNILLAESAAPEGEVVFMSLDEVGAPGRLNRAVLSHFDLGDAFLPDPEDLSGGYAIKTAGEQTFVFIVTVGRRRTDQLLAMNLELALEALLKDAELAERRSKLGILDLELRLWESLDKTCAGKTHCQVHFDGGSIRSIL